MIIAAIQRHQCGQFFLCFLLTVTVFPSLTAAIDLITTTEFVTKDQILQSPEEEFVLGFFSPGRSNNWYIGIWYKNIEVQTVVWVANRDQPLRNSSGVLKIDANKGDLVLEDGLGSRVWSANRSSAGKTVAQLLDSGNLVLRQENDENPENYIWQSFDYPVDNFLPGMKLGWDSKTGLNRYLSSWKSADNPASGDYRFKLDIDGFPEIYLTNKDAISYRSGPWNGIGFSGVPEMKPSSVASFFFKMNRNEVYYSFSLNNKSVYSRLFLSHAGGLKRLTWLSTRNIWSLFWYAPKDQCDEYKECGVYGICDTNASPVCKCMKGFAPKNQPAWNLRNGSDGCVRISSLDCGSDGFSTLSNMKLPDSGTAFVDPAMDLDECRELCRRNCSCLGFSNYNITNGGSGCAIWVEGLHDMRQYTVAEGGQKFYVRVAASDLEPAVALGSRNGGGRSSRIFKIMGATVGSGILLTGIAVLFLWKKLRRPKTSQRNALEHRVPRSHDFLSSASAVHSQRDHSDESVADEVDLPLLHFITVDAATDNFSEANKLGQGGFGSVYKGMLVEGQEIAVKRLSKSSGQGTEEFKNEVKLIARLQHRNLVRLLGCCVEMEEKMLIYEYMENRSLDSILFDKNTSSMLDWGTRFKIICGVGRGLLYLHQDSRFRIIHRDLKASNILLDKDMNPKISDFGMARIFGGDQTEANTRKVVGTYGYMSPEYAMDGLFSVKSDVFSFGVLVLEIVSGKKNRGFYQTSNQLNLLSHAWGLYRGKRGMELMDAETGRAYSESEVMRCIQVGLLCVQEHAEDRPEMSSVMLMLSSEYASMPQPKNPGFCVGRRPVGHDRFWGEQDESCTVNQVTVTIIQGR